jgi:hypothetical protein
MQLLPDLQLQGRLGADIGAAHLGVSDRPSTGPGRCAALLLTRGEESMMYNHSTVLVAAGSLCLNITLLLAWRLAGVGASTFMVRQQNPFGELVVTGRRQMTARTDCGRTLARSHGHFDTLLVGTEVGVLVDKTSEAMAAV